MSESNSDGWKTQTYIRGGMIGLLVGVFAAYLYARAAEESAAGNTPVRVGSSDLVKVSLGILGLVRQITELGNQK